jgi:hypothetical protein
MAKLRAAASTRSEVSGASCPTVDRMLAAKFVDRPESVGRMGESHHKGAWITRTKQNL